MGKCGHLVNGNSSSQTFLVISHVCVLNGPTTVITVVPIVCIVVSDVVVVSNRPVWLAFLGNYLYTPMFRYVPYDYIYKVKYMNIV
jgi:hypothetical protein